jgi:hypothetical protein
MKPHKHAEVIKAWADGATIERLCNYTWEEDLEPTWWPNFEYRIKPEPKPDIVKTIGLVIGYRGSLASVEKDNLKLIYDGETGELKSAEVI